MKNNDATQNKRFYVYTLADGVDVFYVGKGAGGRIYKHEIEARKDCDCTKCQRIRRVWALERKVVRTIVMRTDIEQEAHEHERMLIAKIGRDSLVNKTDGGEGFSRIPPGYIHSRDLRKQLYAEIEERLNTVVPGTERYWRWIWRDAAEKYIKKEIEAAEAKIRREKSKR